MCICMNDFLVKFKQMTMHGHNVFILRVVFTFLQTRSKQNYLQMINDINTTRLPPGTLRSFSTVKRGCHEATEQLGEHHS